MRTAAILSAVVIAAVDVHAGPWTPGWTNTWGWWDPSDAANMVTNASGEVTSLFDLSGRGKTVTPRAGEEPMSFTRLIGTRYGLDFVNAEGDGLHSGGWSGLGSNGVVSIYAVYPQRKHLSPKVRAFVDFLSEEIKDPPYWEP